MAQCDERVISVSPPTAPSVVTRPLVGSFPLPSVHERGISPAFLLSIFLLAHETGISLGKRVTPVWWVRQGRVAWQVKQGKEVALPVSV